MQHDLAFGNAAPTVLIDPDRDPRRGARRLDVSNDLTQQSIEGCPDIGMSQAAGGGLCHPDRPGLLDDYVLQLHCVAPFECSEVGFDPTEAFLLC